jgi:hypothetical protein
VKINNLDTCCEQAGGRGKDYDDEVTSLKNTVMTKLKIYVQA